MVKLELTFSTVDEAHEALGKLAGLDVANVAVEEDKPKKATPKAKAEVATKKAFEEEDAPAAPAKKSAGKKEKVPSVDELKAHIKEVTGNDPSLADSIKEYVRSFGVTKLSDMTDAQRVEAFKGAEAHFASLTTDSEDEGEEDPME